MATEIQAPDVEKSRLQQVSEVDGTGFRTSGDDAVLLGNLGYQAELNRNRSMKTVLFQSLAIAAIPFGLGGPMINSIYGGGQLSLFVGLIMVMILDECVFLSLGEIASRYPTSAGPYYWSHQLAQSNKNALSFITGWIWLIGNWTLTLSVNFGFASMLAAVIYIGQPDLNLQPWHLLLIFYAVLLFTFLICVFMNNALPMVDTACAAWTLVTILIVLVSVSVVAAAGRNSPAFSLANYDTSLSGWNGFTFFIGLLPAAYSFSGTGMIASMSEEVHDPAVKVPWALALCVPIGGIAGLFWIIPLCVVLPPLADVAGAPLGQALPYVLQRAMGSAAGGIGLTVLVLVVILFCSISITTAASRTTWAFARDNAIPLSHVWSRVDRKLGLPVWSIALVTIIQALLGLVSLGSSTAFNGFVSAGVIGMSTTYGIPIAISVLNGRREVSKARWSFGKTMGPIINALALAWIAFELVLFSMPVTLPTTAVAMNYAIVIVVGFFVLSLIWYFIYARKAYKGPPDAETYLGETEKDHV